MRFARHTFAASLVILSSIVVGAPAMGAAYDPASGGGGSAPAMALGPKLIVGSTYTFHGDPKNMDRMMVKFSKVKGAVRYTVWAVEGRKPARLPWRAYGNNMNHGVTTVAAKSFTAAPMQAVLLPPVIRRSDFGGDVRVYATWVSALDARGRTIAKNWHPTIASPSPGDYVSNSNQCAAVFGTLVGARNAGAFAEIYIGKQLNRRRLTKETAALYKLALAKGSQIKIVAGLYNPDWAKASRGQASVTISYLDAAGKAKRLVWSNDAIGALDLLNDIASGPDEVSRTCN